MNIKEALRRCRAENKGKYRPRFWNIKKCKKCKRLMPYASPFKICSVCVHTLLPNPLQYKSREELIAIDDKKFLDKLFD